MPLKLKETNKHNKLKNPNRREADQLAIYKHDRGVKLESIEKLQLTGQIGTWTHSLWISSPVPLPLGRAGTPHQEARVRAWVDIACVR